MIGLLPLIRRKAFEVRVNRAALGLPGLAFGAEMSQLEEAEEFLHKKHCWSGKNKDTIDADKQIFGQYDADKNHETQGLNPQKPATNVLGIVA